MWPIRFRLFPSQIIKHEFQINYDFFIIAIMCVYFKKGVQYFDSGDYNAASRKDKQRIAGLPGRPAMNPAMARLQGRPPSKLTSAGPPPRSGLANVTRSEQ